MLHFIAHQSEQFLSTDGSAAVDPCAVETRNGDKVFGCSGSCIHVRLLKECAEAAVDVRAVRRRVAGGMEAGMGGGGSTC